MADQSNTCLQNEDILDLIEIIRDIPDHYWELLSFIRSMPADDIKKIASMLPSSKPINHMLTADQENSHNKSGISAHSTEITNSEKMELEPLDIENFRKFL